MQAPLRLDLSGFALSPAAASPELLDERCQAPRKPKGGPPDWQIYGKFSPTAACFPDSYFPRLRSLCERLPSQVFHESDESSDEERNLRPRGAEARPNSVKHRSFKPIDIGEESEMAKARNAIHAEEKAEVEVMFARVTEHLRIGKNLKALQISLEGGGRTVKDAIGPVYSNTREHQIMIKSTLSLCHQLLCPLTENIDVERLDLHIDRMLEPGQDQGKEERIIHAGYGTSR